jgi:flavin-dependent dehydrogenase
VADFTVKELSPDTQFDQLRYWDVVIIGAGPAGLAAGLTTAHRGLTTLVTEVKAKAGGQPQFLCANKRIVDVPGFPDGVTGEELSALPASPRCQGAIPVQRRTHRHRGHR